MPFWEGTAIALLMALAVPMIPAVAVTIPLLTGAVAEQ